LIHALTLALEVETGLEEKGKSKSPDQHNLGPTTAHQQLALTCDDCDDTSTHADTLITHSHNKLAQTKREQQTTNPKLKATQQTSEYVSSTPPPELLPPTKPSQTDTINLVTRKAKMSQIALFSLTTCPFCKRAKEHLTKQGWEYTEINIQHYPEKRADMLKLADQLTVPQIFFGNEHIGGATDVLEMEASKLKELYDAHVANGDPSKLSPLLKKPDYEPKPAPEPLPRKEEVCL
jgi:glutaredoxin 3